MFAINSSQRPTDEHEILDVMSQFDKRKSTGHIDISIKLIKTTRLLSAPHLVKIFNDCFDSGNYSHILHLAKVVPYIRKAVHKMTFLHKVTLETTDLFLFPPLLTKYLK